MIKIDDKKKCCGCTACLNICPQKCITMIEDEEGFLYPVVNIEECIDCGICNAICPIINKKNNDGKVINVYAATNKNEEVLLNSSSGGVFAALASSIIKENGIVYGAIYDDNMNVIHQAIDNEKDIKKMQGSKYVESDLIHCFKEIKDYLNKDRKVLYSGTPCQIAGLKNYLKKDYDNLFTCDFICTGVPSRKIFRAFRDYYQIKYKSKLKNIEFRNKKNGWVNFGILYTFAKKKKFESRYDNSYIDSVFKALSLRPACYDCHFKEMKSGSDIKLGDYWNIKKNHPDFYKYNGVSVVIIGTEKGKKLFNEVKNQFDIKESSYEKVLDTNKALNTISKEPKDREDFFLHIKNASEAEIVRTLNKKMRKSLKEKLYYRLFIIVSKIRYKK